MDLHKKLENLEKSDVFKDWKKKNKDAKLAHFFVNVANSDEHWEIGFYDENKNVMTHFSVNDTIELGASEEPLKRPDAKIYFLNVSKVDISLRNALAVANSLREEKYEKHKPIKILALLQKIKDVQVWNFTFISANLETLNIRINSENGDVVSDKLVSLINRE